MRALSGRIRLGVSACLMGDQVRFNAGHKQSLLCLETLAPYVDFVKVCPEMAIGLGAPRPTIRLVEGEQGPRAILAAAQPVDVTDALADYAQQAAQSFDDVHGFILMQKSPSCGVHRVKVYRANGYSSPQAGRGVFAEALMQARPNLPVEEEGRLHDPVLRENFIARVFAYAHWQSLLRQGLTRQGLYNFHATYKYQLLATSRPYYQALGRLLAQGSDQDIEQLAAAYFADFMRGMSRPATRGSHCNVLQHMAGYLKHQLPAEDKAELHQLIHDYREGVVPLVVPLTLLKHHFRNYPNSYIAQQAYLEPHPAALGLRNTL